MRFGWRRLCLSDSTSVKSEPQRNSQRGLIPRSMSKECWQRGPQIGPPFRRGGSLPTAKPCTHSKTPWYVWNTSLVCWFCFVFVFVFQKSSIFFFLAQAPFPIEKVTLGSSKGGWHVQEDEEGTGYQFILKTPYTDGIHAFEAESKNDKAKWIDSLGKLIQKLDA